MTRKPDLLVLGHVTCDDFGHELRLGGAAGYAARAAALLGIETGMVTVAPPPGRLCWRRSRRRPVCRCRYRRAT
jgi:sugar/nucleoside kinase (ribokinase family)